MMRTEMWCTLLMLLVSSAALTMRPGLPGLPGQTTNTLSDQERAQGWQLLFDGKTLSGWHVSAPAPGSGRAAQPPQPGQVGTPTPCDRSPSAVLAGGSHWEVAAGSLTACGEPTGYLTSDRSYKNFVLSIEFNC